MRRYAPSTPNSQRARGRGSADAHVCRMDTAVDAGANLAGVWRKPPGLPRTDSSVLRPSSHGRCPVPSHTSPCKTVWNREGRNRE